ncbi:MAG: nucleoside triphosphate pyrophosphohydrolase [Treponema sp.]|jgi:tetrapyrrole methylase family protein/MazG family protein|nr:nucleoside triphosphate pyrophosphohydrolase [Treponema sp.]
MEKRETGGAEEQFARLYNIVMRLRAPGGCPWDREQNPASLRGDLIEETYECVEAIDEKDPGHTAEELGDIFLLATMLSYMYEQDGFFSVADVLDRVSEKIIRRHPHVFGGTKDSLSKDSGGGAAKPLSSAQVLDNWARIKVEQEGRKPKDSILDEVSRGLPPLDRAWKLQKKAAKAGFDWPDLKGLMDKIREELGEVTGALAFAEAVPPSAPDAVSGEAAAAVEEELGDLLFSVVNLCRYLKVEPSLALQRTNSKFTGRFKYVENKMKERGAVMNKENLGLMDSFWEEAKN